MFIVIVAEFMSNVDPDLFGFLQSSVPSRNVSSVRGCHFPQVLGSLPAINIRANVIVDRELSEGSL